MADYSSLLNSPKPFTDPATGKTYSVSRITQRCKAAFEEWLKARARTELIAMKPHLGAEWREEWRQYQDDVSTGRYAFFSPLGLAAFQSAEGMLAMGSILFGCSADEMQSLLLRYPDEVRAILDEVAAESSPTPRGGSEGNVPATGSPDPSSATSTG